MQTDKVAENRHCRWRLQHLKNELLGVHYAFTSNALIASSMGKSAPFTNAR